MTIVRALIAVVAAAAWMAAPAGPVNAGEAVPEERALAAYARIKGLAGTWDSRSTKGWEGAEEVQVLARGSAVMFTSKIDPHPGDDEAMATLFHMDGGRLLLTHYCVAGNQPRLVATSISGDGATLEFSFLDGTNMKSRDAGHMDRAVFTFESTDRYRSRWSFYKDGRESWMEEIVHTRRR
jgi:hypothetical protein